MFLAKNEFIDLSEKNNWSKFKQLISSYQIEYQYPKTPDLWEILKCDIAKRMDISQEYLFNK